MDTLTRPPASGTLVVIGAGPAGLSMALEALRHTDLHPIVLEADGDVGGLARTVWHRGNGIDIGGHRFFSKSDTVMDWWEDILPITHDVEDGPEEAMLVRSRLSRILHGGRFYDYPVSLNLTTVRNLGFRRLMAIGFSYLWTRMRPRPERSLEDFYINRFGRSLYRTFFREYTEKVWGIACDRIAPDWGAQRVKGLSVSSALAHAVRHLVHRTDSDLAQKHTETSLIERFLYPRRGPGQMWHAVARRVENLGGEIRLHSTVIGVTTSGDRVTGVRVRTPDGRIETVEADAVASTMPVRELVAGLEGAEVPDAVAEVARDLQYRDFLIVGLLVRKLALTGDGGEPIADNWIYLQEPGIRAGRMQILNNWSPALVADPESIWVGVEYFVTDGDDLWTAPDEVMSATASRELHGIGVIDEADVLDSTVLRVPKAYPAYTGSYARLQEVRDWVDRFENLVLIGRNGQHRYNNQDHSMLTAMEAIRYLRGETDRASVWNVNVEAEYHEEAERTPSRTRAILQGAADGS